MSARRARWSGTRRCLLRPSAGRSSRISRPPAPKLRESDQATSASNWEQDGDGGGTWFHCPLPGLRTPHTWNGEPRCSANLSGDTVVCWPECVGAKEDYPDAAAYEEARYTYTDRVKRAIRREEGGVVKGAFATEIVRLHYYYDRDRCWMIRRDKVRPEDGRRKNFNEWRWFAAPVIHDVVGKFTGYREFRDDWLKRQYPEIEEVYLALHWYMDAYLEQAPGCRVVVCEGEHDADTFNALMKAAGREKDLIATCLVPPRPKGPRVAPDRHDPRARRGDHRRRGRGRPAARRELDPAGVDHAKSIKLFREQLNLKGTPEDKDLTDWVEARGSLRYPNVAKTIAAALLDLMAATPPLTEPFGHSLARGATA